MNDEQWNKYLRDNIDPPPPRRRSWREWLAVILFVAIILFASLLAGGDPALGHYSAPRDVDRAVHQHFGNGSLGSKALRVVRCESGFVRTVRSGSGKYMGLWQFDTRTWRSVGGRSLPHLVSASEQTVRARILFNRRGWAPWPVCGRR